VKVKLDPCFDRQFTDE